MRSIGTYYTDMQPAKPHGQNAGRATAVGLSVNRKIILSFPARLNSGRIPDIREVSAILRGDSITNSTGWRELVSAKVLVRAKYTEALEFMHALHEVGVTADTYCTYPRWELLDLAVSARSDSKEVHALEDAYWFMRIDAEMKSGTYADYKKRFFASLYAVLSAACNLAATVEQINADCLDWLPHPTEAGRVLVAHHTGIYDMPEANANDGPNGERIAESWIERAANAARLAARPRVSLAKPDDVPRAAPVADVPQESNAAVMARAVSLVRSRRLSEECEMSRALEAEQQRAEAAAYLAGREKA